jgi:hypothetical protein
VLRYLVPPAVVDLGGDEVVAAKLGDLKPNSGKIFRFGTRPGLLIMDQRRHLSRSLRHLYPPRLHRAVSQRSARGLVCLPQRHLRSQWPQRFRASAQAAYVFDVHLRGDEIVVSRKREA